MWLMRIAVSPKAQWHGVELDVPTGEGPQMLSYAACNKRLGIMPYIMDTLVVLPHGKYEGIDHTTFVQVAAGRADLPGNQGPPRPTPGLELGLFPIDDLPLQHMAPSLAPWLPDELATGAKEGFSIFHTSYKTRR